MSLNETVIEGTLKPDGTLELDEKPKLSPGRVTVVLRQETNAKKPRPLGNDFFQMLQEIWAGQKARGHVPRRVAEVQTERRAMRGEIENEIEAAMRLQEECRQRRQQAEG